MFTKFLTAIFISTLGITTFGHTSFAATTMVDNGSPEEFSEDKLFISKTTPSSIKIPRNDGSTDLTSLPPSNPPLTRESSYEWENYYDEPLSPRVRTNSKESEQECFFEEMLSALKGQQGGVVLLSLGSPSQFSHKKLLSSVEVEGKESAGFSSQIVYRGAIITFSFMGTS